MSPPAPPPAPSLSIPPGGRPGAPRSLLERSREHNGMRLELLDGHLPSDLRGHVFVVGLTGEAGRPLMASDGMIYRFDAGPEGMKLSARGVYPPCWWIDRALETTGDASWLERFHDLSLARVSPLYGARSLLNTAPVVCGNRLLITSDTSRPWEIDPVTLQLVTPIGALREWLPGTPAPWLFPLMFTTAHPVIDPVKHDFYGVNYVPGMAGGDACTDLVRWNAGPIERWRMVDSQTGAPVVITQSAHQLALTADYLVVLETAFYVEMRQLVETAIRSLITLPDNLPHWMTMRPQSKDCVFWIVRRSDLAKGAETVKARRVVIDQEANHFAAQWANPGGQLTLVVLHSPTQDVSEWIRQGETMADGSTAPADLVGFPTGVPLEIGGMGVHVLSPDGGVKSRYERHQTFTMGLGFHTYPGMAPGGSVWVDAVGYDHSLIPRRLIDAYADRLGQSAVAELASRPQVPSSVARFDIASGNFDGWAAPPGWYLLANTCMPRMGAAGGYLFVLAFSDRGPSTPARSSGDEVWIFDADHMARGPLCRIGHPDMRLGFTLHTAFTPTLRPSARDYRVDVGADYDVMTLRPQQGWLPDDFPGRAEIERALREAFGFDRVQRLIEQNVLPRFGKHR